MKFTAIKKMFGQKSEVAASLKELISVEFETSNLLAGKFISASKPSYAEAATAAEDADDASLAASFTPSITLLDVARVMVWELRDRRLYKPPLTEDQVEEVIHVVQTTVKELRLARGRIQLLESLIEEAKETGRPEKEAMVKFIKALTEHEPYIILTEEFLGLLGKRKPTEKVLAEILPKVYLEDKYSTNPVWDQKLREEMYFKIVQTEPMTLRLYHSIGDILKAKMVTDAISPGIARSSCAIIQAVKAGFAVF